MMPSGISRAKISLVRVNFIWELFNTSLLNELSSLDAPLGDYLRDYLTLPLSGFTLIQPMCLIQCFYFVFIG
ncbi:hypothetical protein SJ2017_3767 [Shewanella japonica]|uniref:Uncharacterized protein n=1 Tax=Shewanella japonica TaxID=93973 RepID=A0ABM6JQT6_9GAMM|nr:hypothetical protein SJ2017_3767 [Shewanella japonica]